MASPVLVNGTTGLLATAIFVKGENCNIVGYHIMNNSNATAFVQFFDAAVASPAGPTVGTTVPKWVVAIPTVQQAFCYFQPAGLFFNGGLWVAATTTAGGSGAPNAALTVALAMS